MIRRVNGAAALAGLFLLAACAGGATHSAGGASAVPPADVRPAKDCGGTGDVQVTPCPIRLTKNNRDGIVVTVSGPGVVNSYLGRINGCFNGHLCYNAGREGSSETQWRITSGTSCGRADVEFDGVDAHGGKVGYFFLGLVNKYCPRR